MSSIADRVRVLEDRLVRVLEVLRHRQARRRRHAREQQLSREVVIRVARVGKRYQRLHEKPMLLRDMAFMLSASSRRVDELWAVRDVCL